MHTSISGLGTKVPFSSKKPRSASSNSSNFKALLSSYISSGVKSEIFFTFVFIFHLDESGRITSKNAGGPKGMNVCWFMHVWSGGSVLFEGGKLYLSEISAHLGWWWFMTAWFCLVCACLGGCCLKRWRLTSLVIIRWTLSCELFLCLLCRDKWLFRQILEIRVH